MSKKEKGHSRALAAVLCGLLLSTGMLSACTSSAAEPKSEAAQVPQVPEVSSEQSQPVESAAPDKVSELLAQMTLHEKVCQLIMVFPEDLTGTDAVTAADDTMRAALESHPVGGILLSRSNMKSKQQVSALNAAAQSYAKVPMLITCDEEGGRVNRLMKTVGTTWVDPMLSYSDKGEQTAFDNANTIATDMKALGFNIDMAPVADVWSNPANTVIGDRAYSTDFTQAAELVSSAVKGFRAGGVASTLKHFPGHGDTSEDTHFGSVYVYKSLEKIKAEELVPFHAGIAAGADAVMMGHLIVKEAGEEPAPFSYKLVTELLREEMGFHGVVITDGLRMQAMTDNYTSGEIATRAIQAGVDILLCPADYTEAVAALEAAVASGEITEARIDESVRRILTLKEKYGAL